ncbi:MAG TPA: hypothetical protein VM778_13345 [Gemmatimonadota bacterium]|nr:hypothetical protein [Gemmatimonadota bacterium]
MNRKLQAVAIGGILGISAAGILVADTLTRSLDVEFQTHIEIYRSDDGRWERVDEVGPTDLRFEANLLEIARGTKIGTSYVFEARTAAGKDYSVRLADDADVDFNPVSRRVDVDLVFEVTYDGRTARVVAQPTTESRFGPGGALQGRRGDGVLSRGPAGFTLVSVNEFAPEGVEPMTLVSRETYRLVPRR